MNGNGSGKPGLRTAVADLMGDNSRVITHPNFRLWLRPDGIAQMVWTSRGATTREDAGAAVEALIQLSGGRIRPLLVDMRDTGSQDRATRAEWTRRADAASAVALIVGTPLSRIVGNVFINVSRPPTPTRLFDDEASAVAWLKGYVG